MKTKTLLIGLLTDRIDVLLCSGAQCVDGRRIDMALDQDAVKWPRQVRDAAKSVREAAESMGARGLQARVLYRGPTAVSEYVSPRVNAPRDAASAAILACADSLACPLDAAAAEAVVVAFEKGDQPKSHVVVGADGDDALTAIAEMVAEAGLTMSSAAPLDAVLMAAVAQRVAQAPDDCSATLYFGEHRSFLAIGSNRKLLFARPISVGVDTLVHSLRTPMRLRNGQTLELKREKAREIIHECGFPDRAQVVDASLDLSGGQVIPLLQPALQRCMVEVRQSLRFALPESQRQNVRLVLWGPGSRTPGLALIVSDELGLKVECDDQTKAYNYKEPTSAASELADAMVERRLLGDLALQPLAVTRRLRQRAMRRWLWTGAAAALAMIGFDAMRFNSRLSHVRDQAEVLQTQNDGMRALKETADRLLATSAAMTTLDNTIRRETGSHVYMGAVLKELSRVTPPSIRLANITFKPGSDVVNGVIAGYALDDPKAPGSATRILESYMQELNNSPLMSRLVLSNVQATSVNDQIGQSFEVSFDAVAAPVDGQLARTAQASVDATVAAAEGASP